MKERRIIRLLLLFFIFGSLCFLNPSREQHIDKLKVKFNDAYNIDQENDDEFSGRFEYHNYYIFSTTTDNLGPGQERSSVGILGFVF
jgi:hypothetical protein